MGISCPSVELKDKTRIDGDMAVIPVAIARMHFPLVMDMQMVVSKGGLLLQVTQSFRLKPGLMAPAPTATEPLRQGR